MVGTPLRHPPPAVVIAVVAGAPLQCTRYCGDGAGHCISLAVLVIVAVVVPLRQNGQGR